MSNELQKIVKESGLAESKANIILEQFQDYFQMAGEWEIKAKSLIVTAEDQVAEMKMARTGRLFLQKKRSAVENTRKQLKLELIREGKAIDGIANVLKALIIPIEEYLDSQEKYAINKAAEREELKRLADERESKRIADEEAKKLEEERVAKEKEEAAERERIRKENERLKVEAVKREAAAKKEREEQEKRHAAERAATEKETMKVLENAKKNNEKINKLLAKEREEKEKAEQEILTEGLKVREEKERVEELKKTLEKKIECPFCHKKFTLKKDD